MSAHAQSKHATHEKHNADATREHVRVGAAREAEPRTSKKNLKIRNNKSINLKTLSTQ